MKETLLVHVMEYIHVAGNKMGFKNSGVEECLVIIVRRCILVHMQAVVRTAE